VAGNIQLVASDASKQVQLYKQQMEQLEQKLQFQLRMLEKSQRSSETAP